MAKEKSPAIIFIDELDAIGTKRFDSEKAGDREVQRTMLELLNQLDGFSSTAEIKVSNLKFLMPCPSTRSQIFGAGLNFWCNKKRLVQIDLPEGHQDF